MENTTNNTAKVQFIADGPYRFDWNTGKMVKIEGHTLEIGQLVVSHEYAMNTYNFVCISEPEGRGVQQLVEIGGRHRRHNWTIRDHDRSTAEVFGIGLYYDPSDYRMPAEEIARHIRAAEIQERWNARREENKRKADAAEQQRLREQFAGILTPIADVEGWKEQEKTEKANILNYLKHEHPGTRFTARKSRGGSIYTISWQDGPTASAVRLDCSVFEDHTFDGYQDYNEYTPTNFTKVFGGMPYSVDTNRSYSPAVMDAARADLLRICPEFAELLDTGKLYQPESVEKSEISQHWLDITVNRHREDPTARAIMEAGYREASQWDEIRPDSILKSYLNAQDFSQKEPDTTPTDPKPRKRTTTDSDSDESPAEGLELVEIADGLAVVGDSRATYTNRKAIKAHGAKWNKAAQQWQATTPEACAALRGWFALNNTTDTPTEAEPLTEPHAAVVIDETPASQKAEDMPASQKTAPAEGQTDADELFMLAAFYMPEGVTADELRAIAHGAILNPTEDTAAHLKAEAVRTAAAMMHRADEIRTGCATMRHQNNNPDFNAVDVNSDDYLNAWDECNTQIETFEEYADDIENIALCIAIAAGLSIEEADGLAATYKPEQDDPAQMAMTFDSPAPVTPVTDAEVLETAARIRSTYEIMKEITNAELKTPSAEVIEEMRKIAVDNTAAEELAIIKVNTPQEGASDELLNVVGHLIRPEVTAAGVKKLEEEASEYARQQPPASQKTDEKPASQKLPRIWAGKIDETKKMQFVYAVKIEPNGTQKEQQIIFYGTKKSALNWIADTMHEAREWQSEGRGTNQWYMVDWRQPQNLKYIVRLQEFDARPQMKLIESWNPDSLTNYEKELLAKHQEEEAQIKAEIERAKMLDAIGYPFRGKNADGSYNVPTVDESLYWEYAAGLITIQYAAREFCKCGWTNFVDEDYTRKQFERLNNRWHKLPTLEAA